MNRTAVVLSSFLPMWHHRREAVRAPRRGEPGQQVAERFRMARSDLYTFRARALQAVRQALREQPRGPKRPHNRLSAEREQVVVTNLDQHPTWSTRQLHEHLGDEAPHPRPMDRLRQRHGLTRQPQRPAPRSVARCTPEVKTHARHRIGSKAERGPHRLAWDLRNAPGITMSPTTMKRLKRAVCLATDLSPVAPRAPTAHWLFDERQHLHSRWHGDGLEKVILADPERPSAHLAFLDASSRGDVFCELFREVTTGITIEALLGAMRQWQVMPTQVLWENAGPFRGQLLAAFGQNLGSERSHSSPRHPQTHGKLARAFRDDIPECYRQYERWDFDV
jgi:hypothetical protein